MRLRPPSNAVAFLVAALASVSAVTNVAFAQEFLRGRVVDENQRSIPYAQVELQPADRRIVTDQNGDFAIAIESPGTYELRVRRIGYEPARLTIQIPHKARSITITLKALPRVLDSVRIAERGPNVRYTGVVLDDFGQPVVNAHVIAAGASDLGVRTDSSGHFRLAKAQKGSMILHIRKPGYSPYFGSLALRFDREDTLRVKRLPQGLPEAYILAESGFNRDTMAYAEMDARMRWNRATSAVATREDLDAWSTMNLCQALMRTKVAGFAELRETECHRIRCILEDGMRPVMQRLANYAAAEVEAVEMAGRDETGTIFARIEAYCDNRFTSESPLAPKMDPTRLERFRRAGGVVIWFRRR
jgi:hypothetical protein